MRHVLELRLPELLLALIFQSRIILTAHVNHYPPMHDRVLLGEMEENQ
jgi:hypothetical protein